MNRIFNIIGMKLGKILGDALSNKSEVLYSEPEDTPQLYPEVEPVHQNRIPSRDYVDETMFDEAVGMIDEGRIDEAINWIDGQLVRLEAQDCKVDLLDKLNELRINAINSK